MANAKNGHYCPGDKVVVRAPEEILATLDGQGTVGGLPFMPEMVSFCGKKFRVARRIEKTCVEGHLTRRFPANDVVFLEELRCSGGDHDGCKRGCMIFWKESWLRDASPDESPVNVEESELERLRERLKVKTDQTHYFCQSTELPAATEPFPWKYKPWMVWVALREIWVGNRTAMEVAGLLAHGIRMVFAKRRLGVDAQIVRGANKRTPTQSLDLQPGELVRIRSRREIVETLDSNGRNRGLGMAQAMTQNCGRRFEVMDKFDRMINEQTGEMRKVENTVSLRGLECHCYYKFGGCPRGELQYWREIWLERLSNPSSAGASSASSRTRDPD
jgi:hypothetical protein